MTGKQIKAVREKMGITQRILAIRLHSSVSVVSNWEQNINEPTGMARATLKKWIKKYGIE